MAIKKCLSLLIATIFSLSAHSQSKNRSAKETVFAFKDAINAHDAKGLGSLLTNDYLIIETNGNKNRDDKALIWLAILKMFPDYHIEMNDFYKNGDTVAVFGSIKGSYKGNKENVWETSASWKIVVKDQKIKLWQEYFDTKRLNEILAVDIPNANNNPTPRITGIGGLFFKSKDPKTLREWYKQHLHLDAGPYGAKFDWRQGDDQSKYGCTSWSVFGEKTTYFAPSTKDFMINYRVNNLTQLAEQLQKEGVTLVDTIQDSDYGKFIHILDCEQNKVELWEPKVEDYNAKVGGVK